METKTVEEIIAEAKLETAEIIAKGGAIRSYYNSGRPNHSKESTVLGTAKACEKILKNWPPKLETVN